MEANNSKLSWRRHAALSIAAATLSLSGSVMGSGYLPILGPTPMRFQINAPASTSLQPPKVVATESVTPSESPKAEVLPAQVEQPVVQPDTNVVTPRTGPEPLWLFPLWAQIGEDLGNDQLANSLGFCPAGDPVTATPAPVTVTPEMLTEFFKIPEKPAAPKPVTGPTDLGTLPTAVFVLPSSQASYHSQ